MYYVYMWYVHHQVPLLCTPIMVASPSAAAAADHYIILPGTYQYSSVYRADRVLQRTVKIDPSIGLRTGAKDSTNRMNVLLA